MLLRDEYLHHGKFSSFPQTEVMPSGRWQLAVTTSAKIRKAAAGITEKSLDQHSTRADGYQLSQVNYLGRKKIIL